MKVRVKKSLVENFYGFYGQQRRYPGDEFELVARKGANGKTVTVQSQFSETWMEEVVEKKEEAPAPAGDEDGSQED